MTTAKQDYLTHKAAFILSLDARLIATGIGTVRGRRVSEAISAEWRRWDVSAKSKVLARMLQLKDANPGLDWEREWMTVEGA